MKRLMIEKIKENDGGVYIIMMYFMFFIVLMTSVYVEYNRITHILGSIDLAYERALTGIAISNYDEVYEAIREEQIHGGQFSGGNEGNYDGEIELPNYTDENDYGEVEDELISLLNLTRDQNENKLVKLADNKEEYTIKNFQIEMKHDGTDIDGKYQMYGKADIIVPIYFLNKKIFELDVTVKSKAKWRTRW